MNSSKSAKTARAKRYASRNASRNPESAIKKHKRQVPESMTGRVIMTSPQQQKRRKKERSPTEMSNFRDFYHKTPILDSHVGQQQFDFVKQKYRTGQRQVKTIIRYHTISAYKNTLKDQDVTEIRRLAEKMQEKFPYVLAKCDNYISCKTFRNSFNKSKKWEPADREFMKKNFPEFLIKVFFFGQENGLPGTFMVESVLDNETFIAIDTKSDRIMGIATMKYLNEKCKFAYVDSFVPRMGRGFGGKFIAQLENIINTKFSRKYMVLCSLSGPYGFYERLGYSLIGKQKMEELSKTLFTEKCELKALKEISLIIPGFAAKNIPERTLGGYNTSGDECLVMIKDLE